MTTNWMRRFEVYLTDNQGRGIALSDFKVVFNINWFNDKLSRVATVTIYNLSVETNNRIMGKEFANIKILAGYSGVAPQPGSNSGVIREVDSSQDMPVDEENFGVIYNGDIRYTATGRPNGNNPQENMTTRYITIQAVDGHKALLFSTVHKTLAAGYKPEDLYSLALDNYQPFGITNGIAPKMPLIKFPRGRAIYCKTDKLMDNIAQRLAASWQIVDNKITMVPEDCYVYQAIELNSQTGLIGSPQQTLGAGINVRCLINPNIRVNGLIEINQAAITRALYEKDHSQDVKNLKGPIVDEFEDGNWVPQDRIGDKEEAERKKKEKDKKKKDLPPPIIYPASIAADGIYVVQSITYNGDTRGTNWYMDLMCIASGSAKLLDSMQANQKIVNAIDKRDGTP